MVKAIEWKDGKVMMLDQSRLPLEVKYIECADYHIIAEGIKKTLDKRRACNRHSSGNGNCARRTGYNGKELQGIHKRHRGHI